MKSCRHKLCAQLNPQPVTAFYKCKRNLDGLASFCKQCFMAYYSTPRNKMVAKKKYEAKCKQAKVLLVDLPGEIWKDIVGYIDRYMVSSLGRVKRIDKFYDRFMCVYINKTLGYYQVNLTREGEPYKQHTEYLHRLLAKAFIPNPCDFPDINHKDGDKANNDLNNLEWCTAKQNTAHAINFLHRHGSVTRKRNGLLKLQLPTKWCNFGKHNALKEDFHKNNEALSGLYSYCKDCAAKRQKEYNQARKAKREAIKKSNDQH